MNPTDLKQDLDLLVRDVVADGHLAAGVASKVRVRRRARTAGVGVACVALLGLGAGVTTQLNGGTRTPAPATSGRAVPMPTPTMTGAGDGMPSRAVPPAPGDVTKDGLRFRAQVGGDHLAAGVIGDPGQSLAKVTWVPTTNHIAYAAECYVTGGSAPSAEDLRVRATISGLDGYFETGCQTGLPSGGDVSGGFAVPGDPGAGAPGITVGQKATLTVAIVDKRGHAVSRPDVRPVGAVYNQGPQSVIVDPRTGTAVVALPDVIENNGYNYRIAGVTSKPSGEHLPAVTTPVGEPFLVTYGSTSTDGVVDTPTGTEQGGIVRLAGLLDESPATVSNGGRVTLPQPARGTGTVQLVREGPAPTSGVDFIAIYTQAR